MPTTTNPTTPARSPRPSNGSNSAPSGQAGKGRSLGDMDHVEAQVLKQVAKLFPDLFASLDAFCQRHSDYLDRAVSDFDREIRLPGLHRPTAHGRPDIELPDDVCRQQTGISTTSSAAVKEPLGFAASASIARGLTSRVAERLLEDDPFGRVQDRHAVMLSNAANCAGMAAVSRGRRSMVSGWRFRRGRARLQRRVAAPAPGVPRANEGGRSFA